MASIDGNDVVVAADAVTSSSSESQNSKDLSSLIDEDSKNGNEWNESNGNDEDNGSSGSGSDSSPEVMDSTHELYHHHHNFIPPTYSRLPPDGDEFPNNSWAEDSSKLAGSGFHGDLKDTSKMYRADLKLVGKERAPPPLPPKGPPAASADDQIPSSPPPPLPTSIPPALLPRTASTHMAAAPPAALTRRSSSVEDKLRTSPGYINPPPAPHPRTNEPSKKSVRDKIAMFSSRSNSVEEGPSSNTLYRTTPTPSSVSSTSSLPRPGAFSKSSENLLSNNSTLFSVAATTTPSYTPPATADKWKSSLDIRKSSIESHQYNSYTPKTSERFSSSDRSQSLLDVGLAEPGYRSQFTTPSYGGSSAQLMEQRRRANLSKLRGLVIPADNSSKTKESSTSVVDLPAIISKDSVKSKEPLKPFDYKPSANNKPYVSPGSTVSTDSESDWKLPVHQNVLPKYSPAFKRRSLTPYSPSSPLKSNLVAAPVTFNNGPTSYKMAAEPKSLDSLASPHSDSSFEFQDSKQQGNNLGDALSSSTPGPPMAIKRNSAKHNGDVHVPTLENTTTRATTKAKLEDSDNDSAVSSSRSSISHGLSPPNSPTPQESSSTTPDSERVPPSANDDNSDEAAWRVLKPQSVEAINRKNVLSSAKFSSGLGADGLARPRRSDDEEASYADAEAEDTESSCSELDVSSSRRRPSLTNRLVHHQVRRGSASNNNKRPDTTEEEDNNSDGPPERSSSHMAPSHSKQSSMDVNDLPQLTESPLQAIYDMEAQMAYINEICDSLPNRSDSSSRYYSRRDSETTVIERPVIKERSRSQDVIDAPSSTSAADRRARNRSSSGNESDFSSSVSVSSSHSSKNTEQYRSDSYSRTEPSYPTITEVTHSSESSTSSEEKWSQLERKYSKSLTSVNLLESISSPKVEPPTAPAASVMSKYSTSSSTNVGIEKAFDKMLEKTFGDSKPKATANMPKGRNDFRSLSEKWQQISTTGEAPAAPAPTPSSKPMPGPKPPKPAESPITAAPSYRSLSSSSSSRDTPEFSPRKTSTPLSRPSSDISNDVLLLETPPPVVPRSSLPLKPAEVDDDAKSEASPAVSSSPAPAGTKRSVSVNDIRRAFEKAEIAVSNREESAAAAPKSSALSSANVKESIGYSSSTSSVPSAHFRVSSFDSTTSEDSSATTPASGIYGSVNSLVSSAARDPYGSITSLASSTSLISPQELQQLIDEANQSLEEAGTPSHEVCVIILHREYAGGSLGITLAGGADYETKEITVHKVLTGSIADRDGRVHRGDRVLSINGKSTKGLTHREALTLLKAPRTEVVLVVSRGRTGTNGFQTIDESSVTMDRINEGGAGGNVDEMEGSFQWGPLKAVILIKDGAGLGFSLDGGKGSIYGDKPLTVKKIFVGGPAEKNGELTVGDLIVSIQGVNMSSKSRTEAWNFMKKLTDGDVKLIVRSSTS